MTVRTRPRLTAALLACLALAITALGCGSEDDEGDTGDSAQARALLERAFAKTVHSGEMTVQIKADVEGLRSLREPLELRFDGPFKSNGDRKLPILDWDVTFDGPGQRISGGVIATADNAFVLLQGRPYEIGRDAYARFARRLEVSGREKPFKPGQFGMDTASWLKDAKVEDGDPVGEDDTRKVTGSVDVRKVVKDVVELIDSPEVRRRLERSGQPAVPKPSGKDIEQIEKAIQDIDVELNVDKDDVMRRFFTEIDFNLDDGGDGEDVRGKVSFVYVLSKVGGNPVIRAPSDARPLSELLGGLGPSLLGGGGLKR